MALIAYARVSTDEQTTAPPTDVLRRAGCSMIFEERASGAATGSGRSCAWRSSAAAGATCWLSSGSAGWPARCPTCWRERLEDWGCKRPQPFRSRFGLDFEELTEVGTPNL